LKLRESSIKVTEVPIANVFDRHTDAFSQKFMDISAESWIIEKQTSDVMNALMVDMEKYPLRS